MSTDQFQDIYDEMSQEFVDMIADMIDAEIVREIVDLANKELTREKAVSDRVRDLLIPNPE